jgi:DNA repair protein RadC
LIGKTVINKQKGITIEFKKEGLKHLLNYGKNNIVQLELVYELAKALKEAKYKNFNDKKTTDPKQVLGYLNFGLEKKINNKMEYFRISVIMTTAGKFYYHHFVKAKKS